MSNADNGRRGAGVDRSGATDTTMLIWKTIEATPGITRGEIFAKIEREIPAGWAKRRYAAMRKHRAKIKALANDPARVLILARRFVLSNSLAQMRYVGSIDRGEHDGYHVLRSIRNYQGNPEHVDDTGTKAAEHINRAYAERALYAAGRRMHESRSSRMTQAEHKSFMTVYGPHDDVPD